jgi:hypothetical protein
MAHLACSALALSLLSAAAQPAEVKFSVDVSERATAIYHVACLADSIPCTRSVFESFWHERLTWTSADATALETWKTILARVGSAAPPARSAPFVGNTLSLRPAFQAQRRLLADVFGSTSPSDLQRRAGLSRADAGRLHQVIEHVRQRLRPWWRSARRVRVDVRHAESLLRGPEVASLVREVAAFVEARPGSRDIHVHAIPSPAPGSDLGSATFAGDHVVVEAGDALDARGLAAIALHEATHHLYDGSPAPKLAGLMDQFVGTGRPEAAALYALLNEALATAVQALAVERLDGDAGSPESNDGELYRHRTISRAARGALPVLRSSFREGTSLFGGFVDAYVKEASRAFGAEVESPVFLMSAVAVLPTDTAAPAAAVFQKELQPVNVAATDEWRQYPRLDLVFLMTHDVVKEAFRASFPEVGTFVDKRAFAFRGPRQGHASVFIVSGVDDRAVADAVRSLARLRSLRPSGLLLTID